MVLWLVVMGGSKHSSEYFLLNYKCIFFTHIYIKSDDD